MEILLTDLQEIKVKRVKTLKFEPSPNPYNPDDYHIMDNELKRKLLKDARLSKLKKKLLAAQDGVCIRCGEMIDLDMEVINVDHIVPKADGGVDRPSNMAVLHEACHKQKTSWENK